MLEVDSMTLLMWPLPRERFAEVMQSSRPTVRTLSKSPMLSASVWRSTTCSRLALGIKAVTQKRREPWTRS